MAPQKIVIDTDPGVDDVLAILMGLASTEVDVALISIVFGNTHAPCAHDNLLKIYHLLAQELTAIPDAADRYARLSQASKTILALGEDNPIGGEKAVAAYFVSCLCKGFELWGKADCSTVWTACLIYRKRILITHRRNWPLELYMITSRSAPNPLQRPCSIYSALNRRTRSLSLLLDHVSGKDQKQR